jgi:hypothetical protein
MKEEEFYSPTLYAVSYMVRKLIFIRTSSLLLSLWTGQGRAHSPRSRLIGHSSMCALTAGSRRGADEFVCFHAMRVSPMRALEDGVGGTKPSATDEPSCMRAIMAVSSTTPRRSCRVSIQTNLVRIAHGCSCDDPRPWTAVRCTFSRTVSLACASTRSPQRADDRMTSMIRTSPTHRPEWSCREPPQTNLIRIAHRRFFDDPRPWMAIQCVVSRTVSLACTSACSFGHPQGRTAKPLCTVTLADARERS